MQPKENIQAIEGAVSEAWNIPDTEQAVEELKRVLTRFCSENTVFFGTQTGRAEGLDAVVHLYAAFRRACPGSFLNQKVVWVQEGLGGVVANVISKLVLANGTVQVSQAMLGFVRTDGQLRLDTNIALAY